MKYFMIGIVTPGDHRINKCQLEKRQKFFYGST